MTYYCIADLHGRYDLFYGAMKILEQKDPSTIIFLGDYIDRGKHSVEIVEDLRTYDGKHNLVTLMGNHESMFLEDICFDPHAFNSLKSHKNSFEIREWMSNLELFHFQDKNVFAHAVYNTNREPFAQVEQEVLWHRMNDYEKWDYNDTGYFLTHGHSPRKHGPIFSENRCNMDTGACQTGILHIGCYEKDMQGPQDFITYKMKG